MLVKYGDEQPITMVIESATANDLTNIETKKKLEDLKTQIKEIEDKLEKDK